MRRLLPFLILTFALSSCSLVKNLGLTREEKNKNKAAEYIEKAKILNPSAIEGREIEIPVTLISPEDSGSFQFKIETKLNADSLIAEVEADPLQAPRIIREIVEMPCDMESTPFEDGNFKGTVSISNGILDVDVIEKADTLSGTAKAMTDIINPTRIEKPGFFAKLEESILYIFGLIIALVVGGLVGKFLL
jgi:hypothetical protein